MRLKHISRVAAVSVGMMMLSSCHIYKSFEMPQDSALTQEYVKAQEAEPDTTAFGNLQWEQVFTDPMLVDLINQALANNVDLENARLNVDIARAQLKGAKLSYLPSLALAPNGAGSSYAGSGFTWTYQLPAAVSWEVDIFGKLLNTKRGAKAAVLRSEAYQQAVRSQIICAVANVYYTIANLEAQLQLSRETAGLWQESIQTMRNLKEAGRLNEAAVVQTTANYWSIKAQITDLEVTLHEVNNTMSLLLNVAPQSWAVSPDAKLEAPAILRDEIPMRELAARPDVRAAEQSLATAYYATNQARTNFYPSINLTANGGFTNMLGTFITNPGEWFVQLAGQLSAPIFARGANISRFEAAKAQQEQAMNNFEYTLLNASAEVSEAMTNYEKSDEKVGYLRFQVENMEKSVEYTQELLTLGTSTYLEVLTAQQGLLAAQMSELNTQLRRSQSVITLYQSLGGGR